MQCRRESPDNWENTPVGLGILDRDEEGLIAAI
jgi:hypothetical protein